MDLSYLEEFVAFTACMNESEAARRLHISQPTLSHHISALERELGVKLLNRTQPLTLTTSARVFVGRAAELLASYESMLKEVRDAENQALDLRIVLEKADNAPHHTIYARLFQLAEANPNYFVHYVDSSAQSVYETLKDPTIDCVGVYLTPIQSDIDAGVVFRKVPSLFPNRLCVWVDKAHPLAGRETCKWEDLSGMGHPLPEGYFGLWSTTTRQILEEHIPKVKIGMNALSVPEFLRSLRVDDFQLYDETGVRSITLSLDTRHTLVYIDEPDARAHAYIAYLPDRVSPALRVLLDYLDDHE